MFSRIRYTSFRQKILVSLVLLFSFLLSSNAKTLDYLFGIFNYQISWSNNVYNLILLMVVSVWIIDLNFFKKVGKAFSNWKEWILPSIFLLYLIGVFTSIDQTEAMRQLEMKSSFLLVPLIIFSEKRLFFINGELIFKSYRIGIIVVQIIMLICAISRAGFDFSLGDISYNNLTQFNHPSYMALATSIALILSLRELKEYRSSIWTISEMIINLSFIYLFSSKAGILSLGILLIAVVFLRLTKKQNNWIRFTTFLLMLTVFIGGIWGLSKVNKRFEYGLRALSVEEIEYSKVKESTATRVAIWSLTDKIIEGEWLFGIGSGDSKEQRSEVYKRVNFKEAFHKEFNHHNQFVEIFVNFGLVGLFLLVASIVSLYVDRKYNYYSRLVLLLFTFNFLFESILEKQAGIIMFTCFYCMIFVLKRRGESHLS